MVESIGDTINTSDKQTTSKLAPASSDKSLHLCMVGVDKHWIEKDLIKFLRKSFAMTDKTEDSVKETATPSDELPLKGVSKKRGAAFAFLQFSDLEEKQAFSELFAFTVVPNKHYRIKEATNINLKRGFHQVKSAQEMNQDSIQRKEKRMAEVT